MPSIIKRGRIYYLRFSKTENKKRVQISFPLETTWRDIAERRKMKVLRKMEEEDLSAFDPGFHIKYLLYESKPKNKKPSTIETAYEVFLESKKSKKQRTIDAYKQVLGPFLAFTGIKDRPLPALTAEVIESYLYRSDVIISPNTVRSYARHIKAFTNYLLQKKGWITIDPFIGVDLPEKVDRYAEKMPTEQEYDLLFSTFDAYHQAKMKEKNYRDFMRQLWFKPAIALLYYTGLRLSELAYDRRFEYSGLKGKNLLNENTLIYFPPGKGNKERYIPISKKAQPFLNDYLLWRGKLEPNDYLFVHKRGDKTTPLAGKRIRDTFNFFCKEAGIRSTIQLHGFRHRAVTEWIQDGFSFKEAAMLAGHSSSRVTESTYTHLLSSKIEEKFRRIENNKE